MPLEGKNEFSNSRLLVGVAWSQGERQCMQDTFSIVLNHSADDALDFLGLFDGHGANGENMARFVAQNLCDVVVARYNAAKQQNGGGAKGDFCKAIVDGCLELDERARSSRDLAKDSLGRVMGGSTSLACWFRKGRIYCANVGDSRAVLSVCGGEAVTATDDHKPSRREEKFRIVRAGGYVSNDRVMETLAVARSFGDFGFKQRASLAPEEQMVTALPDITIIRQVQEIDFVVLATDGIWDRMTNQQVVTFVNNSIAEADALDAVCHRLVERCKELADDVTSELPQDNMTVMIAILK